MALLTIPQLKVGAGSHVRRKHKGVQSRECNKHKHPYPSAVLCSVHHGGLIRPSFTIRVALGTFGVPPLLFPCACARARARARARAHACACIIPVHTYDTATQAQEAGKGLFSFTCGTSLAPLMNACLTSGRWLSIRLRNSNLIQQCTVQRIRVLELF